MDNVKIADDIVGRIRGILLNTSGKKYAPINTDELVGWLEAFERLAAIERHLYNLTSNGYDQRRNG